MKRRGKLQDTPSGGDLPAPCAMRRDVAFAVEDGTLLRGYLHSSDVAAPAIVMAHGFSGVKEQIDHYAAFFAAGGFSVLVYDHRGFGSSEGVPRLEVDAFRQLSDWRDAISFAQTLAEVDDASPIGIWGSSFAGGLALVLGASDKRVGCVVAQIPHVSGYRNGREMFNVAQRRRMQERFAADRAARFAGAEPERVPVFSPDANTLCALPPAMDQKHIDAAMSQAPFWKNEVTLRSIENMMQFEPAGWVPYIAPTPLLMVVGSHDTCTFPELQLDVYRQAKEPKRLLLHPGGHFDTYSDHFVATSEAALDWFGEHLRDRAPLAIRASVHRVLSSR